jgi:hypothetical protein
MFPTRLRGYSMIALISALSILIGSGAVADQPTRFTFTPTFKDPDPGKRQWEKRQGGYREVLPSGRTNTFKIEKEGVVHGLHGTIVRKVEEPNFFVFIADSNEQRKQLWWWRAPGPWNFMGDMKEISAPQRID